MDNRVDNTIVNDAGHVSDIAETMTSTPRASGVRHELVQDGLSVRVREVWYWIDTGEARHVDEVYMPINDLVHMAVNMTPGERHHLASVRSTSPTSDWADVQRSRWCRIDIHRWAKWAMGIIGPPFSRRCTRAGCSVSEMGM